MNILVYGFSGKILGGIETYILNMNKYMSSETIFDYIIDGDECVYSDLIFQRGGSVFYVPEVKRNPLKYIRAFSRILKEQAKRGTNILYVQLFSMANILPALLAKKYGYNVVLHAHNNGLQNKNNLYKLIHLLGKRILRHGSYIRFTNSNLSSEFMFGKGIKSEMIYNAIDTSRFSFNNESRKEIRNTIGCRDKTVVGFVGRFMPQKNPIFMLRVFAELLKIKKECELWIVGEGELKSEMEREIEKLDINASVKWLGRRNDVESLMCGMDLLLQPSLFEGLGIVLIEAQATGLPVVSTAEVVPVEAKATSIISFINLKEPATKWASTCVELLSRKNERACASIPEHFKIDFEAKRLENILCHING